jgi:hypothetical protein
VNTIKLLTSEELQKIHKRLLDALRAEKLPVLQMPANRYGHGVYEVDGLSPVCLRVSQKRFLWGGIGPANFLVLLPGMKARHFNIQAKSFSVEKVVAYVKENVLLAKELQAKSRAIEALRNDQYELVLQLRNEFAQLMQAANVGLLASRVPGQVRVMLTYDLPTSEAREVLTAARKDLRWLTKT